MRVTVPLLRLGWGVSGAVFLSPDARTAIKVFHREEQYQTELNAYRILWRAKLFELHGLTIPRPRGRDDKLFAISMAVVRPPFLLDFAGVSFHPPDFSSEVLANWHDDLHEKFGANVRVAYAVYDSLRKLGIYYMDFRHSNMNLEGLPGLIVDDSDDAT